MTGSTAWGRNMVDKEETQDMTGGLCNVVPTATTESKLNPRNDKRGGPEQSGQSAPNRPNNQTQEDLIFGTYPP